MKRTFTFLTLFLFLVAASAHAQDLQDYQKAEFIQNNDTLNYRIMFPKNFSEDKKYPVVLFLHGAGERGDDNEAQLVHGGKLFVEKRDEFPAIVIFPQAPKEDYWANVEVERDSVPYQFHFKNTAEPTQALSLVMGLMDSITKQKYINQDRIYIGGLSMGGMGTYEMLYRKPEMFTAAIAICGGADPEIVKEYPEDFNIWIFHGEKDDVVLPKYSKIMAREINSRGANAKLSLYPEDNHNSWDTAFAEPELLPWLFSHNKSDRK
ncbi:prolyl oligopeptidase family serine peptidase [Antarcticibacterium sp. 1MA-6-2]|uniref:carboxylesterase family protein n=1 Tax=Antarcticibacterium sp. 1MA-6-2 TaxID=2908210 RepID=UPI001F48E8BC|nr:prolyl oligopeptidase family serine peptidase [Antarcticibacterium sp. 1MA-6-2]UJH92753.1 prolyl oligopeptidase family serine peptidase [Antarcticibacterium sp. 1MA-6-2]